MTLRPASGREQHLRALVTRAVDLPYFGPVVAVALLGGTTLVMLPLRVHLNILSVSLIYLILVAVISLIADRWTSIGAAILAFLCFDVFFVLPYYSVVIAAPDHALVLFVFLGLATLTSELVYRVRLRTVADLERGRQMETLYELSQALIANVTLDAMLNAIIERVVQLFDLSACTIIMPADDGEFVVRASSGPVPDLLDREEIALMRWVFEQGAPAGVGTQPGRVVSPHRRVPNQAPPRRQAPRRSNAMLYIPIISTDHTVGVLRVVRSLDKPRFTASEQQLLATLANHVALAIERVSLTEEATRAAVLARSDELKSALLSAVSHELRTPLASIKASATSLLQEDVAWSPEDSRDLLEAIDEETDRLTRIVSNLLDLSRIEAGVLQPEREWNDVDELIRETVKHLRPLYSTHEMQLDVPADLPIVRFDYVQIAQVLTNLIENAAKYSPTAAPVTVSACETDGAVTICVADRGPGIPAGEETRVFDKFYRLESRNGAEGTGMGLSISRGIVSAHGGTIWVERRDGGGSRFCFRLPIDAPAQPDQAVDAEALARS